MYKWKSIDTVPTDRSILLDVGLPFSVVGIFNAVNNCFVYAHLSAGLLDGEYKDMHYINEYEHRPKAWLDLPEINND